MTSKTTDTEESAEAREEQEFDRVFGSEFLELAHNGSDGSHEAAVKRGWMARAALREALASQPAAGASAGASAGEAPEPAFVVEDRIHHVLKAHFGYDYPTMRPKLLADLMAAVSSLGTPHGRMPSARGGAGVGQTDDGALASGPGMHARNAEGSPASSSLHFCWLVEMFGRDGNSVGRYHTGFTDLSHQSRATEDPHQARRYSKEDAEMVARSLNVWMLACEWRAIEHGFATASPPPAAPVPGEPSEPQLPSWWQQFIQNICDMPDRNSPEDEPEAMVATAKELENCALRAIEEQLYAAPPHAEPAPEATEAAAAPSGWLFHCWKPGKHAVFASVDRDDWWPKDQWRGVTRTALVEAGPPELLHGEPPPSERGICVPTTPSDPVADPAGASEPMQLSIIRKWPEGFEARLQHVWLDVVSFIPNVKLYDLQRVLAEFGFRMEVHDDICPRCKGTGEMKGTEGSGPDGWEVDVPCSACGGTGATPSPAQAAQPAKAGPAAGQEFIQDGQDFRTPLADLQHRIRELPLQVDPRDTGAFYNGYAQGHYVARHAAARLVAEFATHAPAEPAVAQGVPEGWQLVLIEPADAMVDDGSESLKDRHNVGPRGECGGINWGEARACYRAMLAASPKVPVEWQLVPKKATFAMLAAAFSRVGGWPGMSEQQRAHAYRRYEAMLVQAPEPPKP